MQSFNGLVRHRRYRDIRVGDIISGAGVGRSTFYEHFRGKDEVFEQALLRVMVPLADAVDERADGAALDEIVQHFWDVRPMARGLMTGPSAPVIARVLVDLIQQRLEALARERGLQTAIPCRVAAEQIAQSQLAMVRGWLTAETPSPTDAAVVLRGTTLALVGELMKR